MSTETPAAAEEEVPYSKLLYGSRHGDIDMVKTQLKTEDVNSRDYIGVSALTLAAMKNHANIVSLLIRSKANINSASKSGLTALMAGASEGHMDVVQLLLKDKADMNVKDSDGRSAVLLAADAGHLDIARALLEAGVASDSMVQDLANFLMC